MIALMLRPQITDLINITNDCPHINTMLPRGPINKSSNININNYAIFRNWIIDIVRMFKLSIKTVVASFDLIERYLHNCPVILNNLQLFGCVCINISAKMLEIYPPDISDYLFVSDHAFAVQDMKELELVVVQRMNNILISCDIDRYVYHLDLINTTLKSNKSIKIYDILYI
jgi:hypothetical protein